MKCLCCGKTIQNPGMQEKEYRWHAKCIRSFFGTSSMPHIDLETEALTEFAAAGTEHGRTVAGVQKKMSVSLDRSNRKKPRMTVVDHPAGYILKPQTDEYPHLPEAEQLVMQMADAAGIRTVPHALIYRPAAAAEQENHAVGKQTEEYAYITRRIDRTADMPSGMLAMEDFCQLSGRLTEDKYKGSYEVCAKIIREHSIWAPLDLSEFYMRILFCFITGNSDMHLKNFSLIEDAPGSRQYRLSPAYDLLPVNIVSDDDEETALTLRGKKRRLKRPDFEALASSCGIDSKTTDRLIKSITDRELVYHEMIRESLIPDDMKDRFTALVQERTERLRENQHNS